MKETIQKLNHIILAMLVIVAISVVVVGIIERGVNYAAPKKPERERKHPKGEAWLPARKNLLVGEAAGIPA